MTTPEETTKAIKDFAIKVRAALGDLTQEEIQDLTDGLEADLAERAAEQGIAFGSAAGYANELRAAAGIAGTAGSTVNAAASASATGNLALIEFDSPTIDASSKPKRVTLTERLANWWQAKRLSSPVLARFLDLLERMRGFWWVLRGYAVFLVLNNSGYVWGLLPTSKVQVAFLAFCLLCSFILGMKFWNKNFLLRVVALAGHLITVYALLVTVFSAYGWQDSADHNNAYEEYRQVEGIWQNGQPIYNIFAYDKDGKRIPVVQLFDQSGNPISSGLTSISTNGLPYTNGVDTSGNTTTLTTGAFQGLTPVWNAWPLLKTSDWPDTFTGKLPTTPFDSPVTTVPKLTITAKHLLPTPTASPAPSSSASPSGK